MKLADATTCSLAEARLAWDSMPILENGEGPRWKFAYSNFNVDPNPDVLLLGAYKHPNTKNNLVGGVNLHYLTEKQRDDLARILPEIMKSGNLKTRYWTGRRLLPEVFENYYRTYDAKYIHGVRKDVMYPKFGFVKTAQQWLKKKLGGMFKTKKQKEKEAQPEYPDDLSKMQDRLDQVVAQLQQQEQPEQPEPTDTPQMQTARQAFQDFQREKTLQRIRDMETKNKQQKTQRRVRDLEDRPMRHAQHDLEQELGIKPEPEEDVVDQQQAKIDLEMQRRKNQNELENPENEIDLGEGEIDLDESIAYYSPRLKRYVFERDTVIIG